MVSVVRPRTGFFPGNSICLTARAARLCLHDAGVDPGRLGLLINTGIYRYKNTGEPSIAALVQAKIAKRRNNHGDEGSTFSFDLNEGACGLMTGIEIIHGLLMDEEINFGMVVTGDSEPFHGLSEKFYFNPAAAAIILTKAVNDLGFNRFRTYDFPEYLEEFRSSTHYQSEGRKKKGGNLLSVIQKDTYADFCAECAIKSLNDFLDISGISLNDVDLIIPSQCPPGFISKLKTQTIVKDILIELPGNDKAIHTAGPAFALKKAWDDNRFRNSRNIIFLTVGSGISVNVTLYVN